MLFNLKIKLIKIEDEARVITGQLKKNVEVVTEFLLSI